MGLSGYGRIANSEIRRIEFAISEINVVSNAAVPMSFSDFLLVYTVVWLRDWSVNHESLIDRALPAVVRRRLRAYFRCVE